jgi:predicted Ser/Thr protein kinase
MEMCDLNLPEFLLVIGIVGEGRRSVTFKASYRGEIVALKVYREEFVQKYQQRYKLNIAQFELSRNEAFFAVGSLRSYAARPITVLGIDDDYSLCFLQEFIDGPSLVELAEKNQGLPQSVLDAGRIICEQAEASGLHDLDLFYKNILCRQQNGVWLPVIHDFNLVPQYQFPPNPILALAYLTGIRKKSHRDWRCLQGWQDWSDHCQDETS